MALATPEDDDWCQTRLELVACMYHHHRLLKRLLFHITYVCIVGTWLNERTSGEADGEKETYSACVSNHRVWKDHVIQDVIRSECAARVEPSSLRRTISDSCSHSYSYLETRVPTLRLLCVVAKRRGLAVWMGPMPIWEQALKGEGLLRERLENGRGTGARRESYGETTEMRAEDGLEHAVQSPTRNLCVSTSVRTMCDEERLDR